jgi:glycosyltransferase involved in cell wall biosynthesis
MSPELRVAIIVPIYNESGVVEQFHANICAVVDKLPFQFTFYYIDDGSNDGTEKYLDTLVLKDRRVKVITLSRNFGHQAALSAGLDRAEEDVVISMDGDGQHPPEMIPQMLGLIRQGYDIVQTQRIDETQPASFKKWTSGLFYRLINTISGTRIIPGTADFRALSRSAVNAIKSMPEYHRFLRGMVAWIGFSMVILPYRPVERISGQSKYSFRKMFDLAMNAIFSFSLLPLYIGLSVGGFFLFLAVLEVIYVLSFWVTDQTSRLEPGWSSLMFMLLIIGGVLMILLGFIGVYVGFIFQEAKHRPVYLIKGEKQDGK